jgi:hypothetical protein
MEKNISKPNVQRVDMSTRSDHGLYLSMTEPRSVPGSNGGTNRPLILISFSTADPTLSTLASSCDLPNMNTENLDLVNIYDQHIND